MGQEYLPNRLGLASGITLGAAIGVGGARRGGARRARRRTRASTTTLWVIALTPLPALLIALDAAADLDRPPAARGETRKPRWCGALRAGHGSPLNYFVPGLLCLAWAA